MKSDWMEGPIGRSLLSFGGKFLVIIVVVFLIIQTVHPGRLKELWHYYVYSPTSAIGSIIYGMVHNPYTFLEMSVQAERLGDFVAARRFMAYGIFLLDHEGTDKEQLAGFRARLLVMQSAIVPPFMPFEGNMLLGPPKPADSVDPTRPAATANTDKSPKPPDGAKTQRNNSESTRSATEAEKRQQRNRHRRDE